MTDQETRTTTYAVKGADHELAIVLEGRHCQDSMSGEMFETKVTVVLDGEEFRGCGRPLH
mgnify:CR=1 FL=1